MLSSLPSFIVLFLLLTRTVPSQLHVTASDRAKFTARPEMTRSCAEFCSHTYARRRRSRNVLENIRRAMTSYHSMITSYYISVSLFLLFFLSLLFPSPLLFSHLFSISLSFSSSHLLPSLSFFLSLHLPPPPSFPFPFAAFLIFSHLFFFLSLFVRFTFSIEVEANRPPGVSLHTTTR